MGNKRYSRKTEIIRIRCSPETKRRFKIYAIDYRNWEEALVSLLDKAEQLLKVEGSRAMLDIGKEI